MQGNKETIAHFLNNSNEQIIVPVYQRNYSWKQSNCDQLYDDLMQNIESNKESPQALTHFFGSVVEEEWSPVNKIDNLNRDFFVLCHD